MYRSKLIGAILIGAFSLVALTPGSSYATPPSALGTWSLGLSLDSVSTDCDTTEIRFLRDELKGILKIATKKVRIGKHTYKSVVFASALGMSWEGKLTRRGFKGTASRTSGGAIRKETFILGDVTRAEGTVEIQGTVASGGVRCSYGYYGSVAR